MFLPQPVDLRQRRRSGIRQFLPRRISVGLIVQPRPMCAQEQYIPVNLVLVAEGKEQIGSPHFPAIVRRPEVQDALKSCTRIFIFMTFHS